MTELGNSLSPINPIGPCRTQSCNDICARLTHGINPLDFAKRFMNERFARFLDLAVRLELASKETPYSDAQLRQRKGEVLGIVLSKVTQMLEALSQELSEGSKLPSETSIQRILLRFSGLVPCQEGLSKQEKRISFLAFKLAALHVSEIRNIVSTETGS